MSRISRSAAVSRLKYWRAASRPWTRNAVSTRSPPSSYLPKNGRTLPVRPSRKCGQAPWKRSARARKPHDLQEALRPLFAGDELAIDAGDDRHHAEAGRADRDQPLVAGQDLDGHPGVGIGGFPVVAERRLLHHRQQLVVAERMRRRADGCRQRRFAVAGVDGADPVGDRPAVRADEVGIAGERALLDARPARTVRRRPIDGCGNAADPALPTAATSGRRGNRSRARRAPPVRTAPLRASRLRRRRSGSRRCAACAGRHRPGPG